MHKTKMNIEIFSWLKIYGHKFQEYMMINTNTSTKAIWSTLTRNLVYSTHPPLEAII